MNKQNNRFLEFDNFRADPQHKCLWFGSELVSLTPRSFDTLLVLIENNGRVVDKETLLNQVWGNTFVEEAALKQNISTLRKKLDSLQSGKQFIETIPRRGYRFVGDVREVFDEEEVYVVEKRTRTHIVTNQEIHLSDETSAKSAVSVFPRLKAFSKNTNLVVTGIFALIIILAASFFAVRYFFQPQPMAQNKFSQFEISQITASGNIHKVAISPNGKYLALVEKKNDLQTVFLRQTDNSNNVEIIAPTKDDIIGITFSPDNDSLFYAYYPHSEPAQMPRIGVLSKIPILGGAATKILKDIDSPITFSPDGTKYSFIRDKFQERQSSIIIFDSNTDENNEKILTSRSIFDRFNKDGISWSPDGKKIATVAYNSKDVSKPFQVIIIDVESGQPEILSDEPWSWMGQIGWLNDGSGVVLTAFSENSPNFTDEVWIISYPSGKTRKVTNGINGFYGLGLTANSNNLITVKSDNLSGLWMFPKGKTQEAKLIQKNTGNGSHFRFGMTLTADGKFIYSTAQSGNADIWIMEADGSRQRQLTNNEGADFSPVASKDGKNVVFISNRSGTKNIWKMNLDGTNQTQLTNFENVFTPSLTPDGNWIYFSASTGKINKLTLWKISIDGGQPQAVSDLYILSPKVSPDGKYIACYYPENGVKSGRGVPLKLTVLSINDASLIKQFDVTFNESQFAWASDSKSVSYIEEINGGSTIIRQPIDGGSPLKEFVFQDETIINLFWSNDGENLFVNKGMTINDVILIKDVIRK